MNTRRSGGAGAAAGPMPGADLYAVAAQAEGRRILGVDAELATLRKLAPLAKRLALGWVSTAGQPGHLTDAQTIAATLDVLREWETPNDVPRAADGSGEARERAPITHVAVRWEEQVWSLPKPFRHHHIIETISRLTGATSIDCHEPDGQGFLDSTGRYLTRKQALVSALINKQVKDENDIRHNMLFSEDLW